MAAITDEILLTFVDTVRHNAEAQRADEARVESLEDDWNNIGGAGAVADGSDTVENRTDEGVQILTWDEVTNIVASLQAQRDVVTETPGRAGLIAKACIRSLGSTL